MTSARVVFFTTFSNREAAAEFATKLVAQKYAAGVNLVEGVTSFYEWKGKQHASPEVLVIGRTTEKAFAELKTVLKDLHPYELPELISVKISDGYPPYLDWISKGTR